MVEIRTETFKYEYQRQSNLQQSYASKLEKINNLS